MATTNHTPTIELSQYVSTDKTSYLVNYNDDMLKIDGAIASDRDDIATAQNTADTAEGKADTNKLSIDAINETLNDNTTGVLKRLGDVEGDVNTIESLIGNGTPTTTDKTIIGAINELDTDVNAIESKTNGMFIVAQPEVTMTYTGDAGNTFATAIVAAIAQFFNDVVLNLPDNDRARVREITVGDFTYTSVREAYYSNLAGSVSLDVTRTVVDASGTDIREIAATNLALARFYEMKISDAGAVTLSDRSSNSFADDIIIRYEIYRRL